MSWYQAEKSRLGPGPVDELIRFSLNVHVKLKEALSRFECSEIVPAENGLGGACANRELE